MLGRYRGRIDRSLLTGVFLLALAGVLFIYSATYDVGPSAGTMDPKVVKQIFWVSTGFLIMLFLANIDYMRIVDLSYFFYFLNLLALLLLFFFGGERYGARRWLSVGPVSLQPSEFMKVTMILVLSSFLGSRSDRRGSFANFFGAILLVAPAILFIFIQPDLGTSFVLIPILFSILFICGERIKYLVLCISAGLVSLPFFWSLLKDYQKSRLMVFMNPDIDPLGAGYTIIQSKIAIGSGGLWGKGWLNGTQSYLKFLPERHTDFIFSVVGEEWGFAGAVLLVGLYVFIMARGISIMSRAGDTYGRAIAAGVVTLMAFQVFVNISMTIGLMPVVGLPLPAISYGGSSTVTTLAGIGLLLSVGRKADNR
jgi:rod shape determining protein RodA